jgi:hypothetical protein
VSKSVPELVTPKERRSSHQTQWAAQFAVASELCKRGYEVAFTMGNRTPLADLMVVSPKEKTMFLVDVKGLSRPNAWIIHKKQRRDNLFYILTHVPDDRSNQFFILTQQKIDAYIDSYLKRHGRSQDYKFTGFNWSQVKDDENEWGILPA